MNFNCIIYGGIIIWHTQNVNGPTQEQRQEELIGSLVFQVLWIARNATLWKCPTKFVRIADFITVKKSSANKTTTDSYSNYGQLLL